jgi:glycosyltransferase involved in cell wall biosynthesis
MKIGLVSDFDLMGSGYLHIASNLGTELTRRGHDVTALGVGYRGDEHHFPYRIVPLPRQSFTQGVKVMLANLVREQLCDAVIVVLDIPMIIKTLGTQPTVDLPFYGVFPVEAPPLTSNWSTALYQLAGCFVISEFGTQECLKKGLEASHVAIPVDTKSWRPPSTEERAAIRKALGVAEGQRIVLTVAENQERKNLSASLEIIARTKDVSYFMVTRRDSGVGWYLDDYINELGLQRRVSIVEKGIPFKELWSLYAAADAFLITSKAEGLGMPVLEAMSMGVPVVAPDHTAFHEHLSDGRGYLIPCEYENREPFGNGWRYYVDVDAGAFVLESALSNKDESVRSKAFAYVEERTWEQVGEVVCRKLTL